MMEDWRIEAAIFEMGLPDQTAVGTSEAARHLLYWIDKNFRRLGALSSASYYIMSNSTNGFYRSPGTLETKGLPFRRAEI